jgi:hypothetical protein
MSTRCGCASDTCACYLSAGSGVAISGGGTRTNPYLIESSDTDGGLPVGGTTDQYLIKNSSSDFDTRWGVLPRPPVVINAQTGTAYTLALVDASAFVTMDNVSASTLTVPPHSAVPFPIATVVEGAQLGVGQLTITPGSGVTVNGAPGRKLLDRYSTFGIFQLATNVWIAYGRLAA